MKIKSIVCVIGVFVFLYAFSEEKKNKIEGWRKMGVAMGAIAALTTFKDTIHFKIAVIIGIIAIILIGDEIIFSLYARGGNIAFAKVKTLKNK